MIKQQFDKKVPQIADHKSLTEAFNIFFYLYKETTPTVFKAQEEIEYFVRKGQRPAQSYKLPNFTAKRLKVIFCPQ